MPPPPFDNKYADPFSVSSAGPYKSVPYKDGKRDLSNVPDVILLAAKPGILAASKVPDVILLAARLGISAATNALKNGAP